MKKYHVVTGDGKGYYGVSYESYRETESLLKISQEHDPQAHIVAEEYHFTNADRIRAMNDAELARFMAERNVNEMTLLLLKEDYSQTATQIEALRHNVYCALMQWLKQPVEER